MNDLQEKSRQIRLNRDKENRKRKQAENPEKVKDMPRKGKQIRGVGCLKMRRIKSIGRMKRVEEQEYLGKFCLKKQL